MENRTHHRPDFPRTWSPRIATLSCASISDWLGSPSTTTAQSPFSPRRRPTPTDSELLEFLEREADDVVARFFCNNNNNNNNNNINKNFSAVDREIDALVDAVFSPIHPRQNLSNQPPHPTGPTGDDDDDDDYNSSSSSSSSTADDIFVFSPAPATPASLSPNVSSGPYVGHFFDADRLNPYLVDLSRSSVGRCNDNNGNDDDRAKLRRLTVATSARLESDLFSYIRGRPSQAPYVRLHHPGRRLGPVGGSSLRRYASASASSVSQYVEGILSERRSLSRF